MKALKKSLIPLAAFALMAFSQAITLAATTEEIARGNCKECASICDNTASYCSGKKDNHANATVIGALKDCSIACKATGDFLARGSAFSKKSAAMCLDALNLCTKSCESFSSDNKMKACADECRKATGNLQKVVATAQ